MNFSLLVSTIILFFAIGISPIYAQKFIQDSQQETHPYREFNEIDKIDSVKVYYLNKNVLLKKLPKNIGKVRVEFFFDKGKLIRVNEYSNSGELWDIYEFEYLVGNNYIVRKFDWSTELKYLWHYENNLISKAEKYNANGNRKCSWVYTYERDSLLILEQRFDKNGLVDLETIQEYDAAGNRIMFKQIEQGVLLGIQSFQYDSLNNIVSSEIYDTDSTVVLQYQLSEDTLSKVTHVNKNHEQSRKSGSIKYFYSDRGKITRREVYKVNGKLDYSEEFKYDEQNRLFKHQVYNAKRLLAEEVCDFDKNNNLLSKKYYQVLLNKPRLIYEHSYSRNSIGNLEWEVKKRRDTNTMEVYRYYYY